MTPVAAGMIQSPGSSAVQTTGSAIKYSTAQMAKLIINHDRPVPNATAKAPAASAVAADNERNARLLRPGQNVNATNATVIMPSIPR